MFMIRVRKALRPRHICLTGPNMAVLATKESTGSATRSAVQLARRHSVAVALWAVEDRWRPGAIFVPAEGIFLGEAQG